jgi:hypothetical protein
VRERHLLQSHIQKHENVINQPRPVCGVATIGCQSEACGGALTRRWKAGRKERALEAQERRQRQTEAARRRERTSRRERMVAMTAAGSAESIAGGEAGSIGSGGEGGDMVVRWWERSGGGFLSQKQSHGCFAEASFRINRGPRTAWCGTAGVPVERLFGGPSKKEIEIFT